MAENLFYKGCLEIVRTQDIFTANPIQEIKNLLLEMFKRGKWLDLAFAGSVWNFALHFRLNEEIEEIFYKMLKYYDEESKLGQPLDLLALHIAFYTWNIDLKDRDSVISKINEINKRVIEDEEDIIKHKINSKINSSYIHERRKLINVVNIKTKGYIKVFNDVDAILSFTLENLSEENSKNLLDHFKLLVDQYIGQESAEELVEKALEDLSYLSEEKKENLLGRKTAQNQLSLFEHILRMRIYPNDYYKFIENINFDPIQESYKKEKIKNDIISNLKGERDLGLFAEYHEDYIVNKIKKLSPDDTMSRILLITFIISIESFSLGRGEPNRQRLTSSAILRELVPNIIINEKDLEYLFNKLELNKDEIFNIIINEHFDLDKQKGHSVDVISNMIKYKPFVEYFNSLPPSHKNNITIDEAHKLVSKNCEASLSF